MNRSRSISGSANRRQGKPRARGLARGPGLWPGCLVAALLALTAQAQVTIQGQLKNFKFPDYYPAASPRQTNQQLRTLLSGAQAWQQPGGQVQIKGLRIETFREDGRPELNVKAADCVFDIRTREAVGAGRLEVSSANGLYALEGEGFRWWQSNAMLVVSNRVVATLRRGLLAARSLDTAALTNQAAATSEVVRVSSDRCEFDSQAFRAVQSGHVKVDDPQMEIGCETLRVQFSPARRLEQLAAEGGVSVLNKADGSRATAGRALYELNQDRETISMLDRPLWRDRDGRQEARAERFVFDRTSRRIRGEGGAEMRLMRGNFTQPALGLAPSANPTQAPPQGADTNQIVITSDTLALDLPAPGRPMRTATAEGKVVIASAADAMRATGDRAVYREDTGAIELLDHAVWTAGDRWVRAKAFSMDRTNRVFTARGKALAHFPLGGAVRSLAAGNATNRPAATNLVLEVESEEMVYRTNTLVFLGDRVLARLYEGPRLRGDLGCGRLTVRFSNRLERIEAETRVLAQEYPPPGAAGRQITNMLNCETLTVEMAPDERSARLTAATNVQAAQVQLNPPPARTVVTELTCGRLTALYLPKAGKVEWIEATEHVAVAQEDKRARAGRAVYSEADGRAVLSDHPYAEFENGRILNATELIWNRTTRAFRGVGAGTRIELKPPAGGTNLSLPLLPFR